MDVQCCSLFVGEGQKRAVYYWLSRTPAIFTNVWLPLGVRDSGSLLYLATTLYTADVNFPTLILRCKLLAPCKIVRHGVVVGGLVLRGEGWSLLCCVV